MKVFISFGGIRGELVAGALHEFLSAVFDEGVDIFYSPEIEAGQLWPQKLAEGLEQATMGILCLTRDSMAEHFLLFEAGSLSHAYSAKVVPLLFGDLRVNDLPGPLKLLQARLGSEASVKKLLSMINREAESPLDGAALETRRKSHWQAFEKKVNRAIAEPIACERIVLHVPLLRRSLHAAELTHHIVRLAETRGTGARARAQSGVAVEIVTEDRTAYVLEDLAKDTPGGVVIAVPESPLAYDQVLDLDPNLSAHLIALDVPLLRNQNAKFHKARFFRKVILVNHVSGGRLAARAVQQEARRLGHTRVNVFVCEGDHFERGTAFRNALDRASLDVLWLDDGTRRARFSRPVKDAADYCRSVLRNARSDVALRPNFVFCACDDMALGVRSSAFRFLREGETLRIISFGGSLLIRELIELEDAHIWNAIDSRPSELATRAVDAALSILKGGDPGARRQRIKPLMLQ